MILLYPKGTVQAGGLSLAIKSVISAGYLPTWEAVEQGNHARHTERRWKALLLIKAVDEFVCVYVVQNDHDPPSDAYSHLQGRFVGALLNNDGLNELLERVEITPRPEGDDDTF